jgi:hypothetical protein
LIYAYQSEFSAQLNGSLNAMKAPIADKNCTWQKSWRARCAIAVLDFNKEGNWQLQLCGQLGFPALSDTCRRAIDRRMRELVKTSAARSTKEIHANEQQRRISRKESDNTELTDAKKAKLVLHQTAVETLKHLNH